MTERWVLLDVQAPGLVPAVRVSCGECGAPVRTLPADQEHPEQVDLAALLGELERHQRAAGHGARSVPE